MSFFNNNKILLFAVLGVVFFLADAGPGQARDPFFDPRPPIEAYDFPRAAEDVQLRGLLVMENGRFRALIYVRSRGEYLVLSPMDRFSVAVEGLRHEFRVLGIGEKRFILKGEADEHEILLHRDGGRRLVLKGEDGEHYNIGVRESD